MKGRGWGRTLKVMDVLSASDKSGMLLNVEITVLLGLWRSMQERLNRHTHTQEQDKRGQKDGRPATRSVSTTSNGDGEREEPGETGGVWGWERQHTWTEMLRFVDAATTPGVAIRRMAVANMDGGVDRGEKGGRRRCSVGQPLANDQSTAATIT